MDEGGLTIHNTKFINNSAPIGQAICAYYVEGYGDDPNIELINNDVDLTRLSLITNENGVK